MGSIDFYEYILLQVPMMKYTVFNVKTLNLDAVQMMRLQLEVLILKVNNWGTHSDLTEASALSQ